MHVHIMNVQRGAHDKGTVAAQCSTCHGTENNLSSGVPGAPHWQLAPKSMAWVGLSKAELCRRLKDPKDPNLMAGGMTKEKFIKHNAEDKLVGWGWNPGAGREPAPMTQKNLVNLLRSGSTQGLRVPTDFTDNFKRAPAILMVVGV